VDHCFWVTFWFDFDLREPAAVDTAILSMGLSVPPFLPPRRRIALSINVVSDLNDPGLFSVKQKPVEALSYLADRRPSPLRETIAILGSSPTQPKTSWRGGVVRFQIRAGAHHSRDGAHSSSLIPIDIVNRAPLVPLDVFYNPWDHNQSENQKWAGARWISSSAIGTNPGTDEIALESVT
jgi:hypothetical protein